MTAQFMTAQFMNTAATAAHIMAALAVILLAAAVGRAAARAARQPAVVGEVAVGLLALPAVAWLGGPRAPAVLLPGPVAGGLGVLAEVGLALFLVGAATELRFGAAPGGRALGRVTAGALLPGLVAGAVLGWWLVTAAPPALRGPAPSAALVVFIAVAMGVTAVPVLARLLVDCGLTGTRPAALALGAAVATDVVCWLGLTVALGLAAGTAAGWPAQAAGLAVCVTVVPPGRRLLRTPGLVAVAVRRPVGSAVALAVAAPAAAAAAHWAGISALTGAVAVALAVPATPEWSAAARRVGRVGAWAVPVFFVVTGSAALDTPGWSVPWGMACVLLAVGLLSKIGGGWAGARAAGEDTGSALRVGVLLNARGVTELVVLQVGVAAGVLSTPLFLAMAIMALASTAVTGPLLSLLDRKFALPDPPAPVVTRPMEEDRT